MGSCLRAVPVRTLTGHRDSGNPTSPQTQGRRARTFLDAYRVDRQLPIDSLNQVVPRLTALTIFKKYIYTRGNRPIRGSCFSTRSLTSTPSVRLHAEQSRAAARMPASVSDPRFPSNVIRIEKQLFSDNPNGRQR